MNWTKKLPTRPGDYRNREHESEPHWFIEVRRNQAGQMEGRLASHLTWHPLERFGGEWSGPLVSVEGLESYEHMTLRTYAAIKLRVPESGIEWLDDMIRKAKRDELAGQALAGLCSQSPLPDTETEAAKIAYLAADAMMAQGKAN